MQLGQEAIGRGFPSAKHAFMMASARGGPARRARHGRGIDRPNGREQAVRGRSRDAPACSAKAAAEDLWYMYRIPFLTSVLLQPFFVRRFSTVTFTGASKGEERWFDGTSTRSAESLSVKRVRPRRLPPKGWQLAAAEYDRAAQAGNRACCGRARVSWRSTG